MDRKRNSRRGAGRGALVCLTLVVVALASGCAYFNTFYNAKSNFKKAESERKAKTGMLGAESYQRCIDKCQTLMRYYPKSKYIDDALYLIGLSRLYRSEYVQARASLEELVTRFPKSEYVERAYYNMGLAALLQDDAAGAASAFSKLAAEFPDSKLNVEAVFRSAEARLDARDYEKARDELRAFLRDHPKSDLVGEAQLRLARTYFDEKRYAEAQTEYEHVLDHGVSPEAHYEAELNGALSQRALAEQVLENPVLQRSSRMRKAAKDLARFEAQIEQRNKTQNRPKPPPPAALPTGPGGVPPPAGTSVDEEQRQEMERQMAAAAESLGIQVTPPEAGPQDQETAQPEQPESQPSASAAPADSTTTGATVNTNVVAAAAESLAASLPLEALEEKLLRDTEKSLDRVGEKLVSLRKPAARLDRLVDLDIEIAVTRALRGEPGDAIADLDQLARSQPPKSEPGARARYEIGEIYRRLGEFEKARSAYDESLKDRPQSAVSEAAQRKSTAIVVRGQAAEELKKSPEMLAKWNAQHAESLPVAAAGDSSNAALGNQIALETQFEDMAARQLRIAEIDLLELDQPLVALREFQEVLEQYRGSLQGPRAAFGIAWIYHHKLQDPDRAKQAYETVVREHGDSPQGREAREILDRWAQAGAPEVHDPSSRP